MQTMTNDTKDRLLFIDAETGGLDPKVHSLLSLGLVVWDKTAGILYQREVCQKLDKYNTTKEALNINHFDIKKYAKEDILSAVEIDKEVRSLKDTYFSDYAKIPLAGHNVQFDFGFLKEMYENAGLSYEDLFSHRLVDIFSVLQFLIHTNKIPKNVNNSSSAFEYFNIDVHGRHTALGDSKAAAELYSKLLGLFT